MTGYFKLNSNIGRPRGTLNDFNVYFFFPFLFTAELFFEIQICGEKEKKKAKQLCLTLLETTQAVSVVACDFPNALKFLSFLLFFFCSISRFLFPSEMFTHILDKGCADRLLQGLTNRSVENPISTSSNQTTTTEGVKREVCITSRGCHMTHYPPR